MKLKLIGCLILVFAASCTVDYDIEPSSRDEPDRIIVNGYLNPDRPVRIQLYESRKSGNGGYLAKGLTGSHVTLKENGRILFDDTCQDSILTIAHYPQTNAAYSIEVSYDGLQTVNAQTSVPEAIHCLSDFSSGEKYWDKSKYLVQLNSFEFPRNNQESLWITSYQLYENEKVVQYNELYANNALIDKANSVAGMEVKNDFVGSIYYNGFLRIKNKNLPHLADLIFTPNYVADGKDYMQESSQTGILVKLITASPEYDRYNKSLYDQKYMIVYDEDISSVFYQPKAVYSNIENGLGIFAGMSETNYSFDLPVGDDE